MNVLAVVLARAGSERLRDKNIMVLNGDSLVAIAGKDAIAAECVTHVAISTDSKEIAAHCCYVDEDIEWIERPAELSGPTADISSAIKHCTEEMEKLKNIRYDYVVGLQAAVPARPKGGIDELVRQMEATGAKGGLSMVKRKPWTWIVKDGIASTWFDPNNYPRSQDCKVSVFEEINSIMVAHRSVVAEGKRWAPPLSILELPPEYAIDIDTKEDYLKACGQWAKLGSRKLDDMKVGTYKVKGSK